MQPMVSIQNLTRRYGATLAVNGVSVQIRRGEIVGLLGQNGAGKTTVMKVLTGYLEPSAGTVLVDGQDVVTHRTEVQARLGYLPEAAPLYPEMLVQDYLLLMAELRGIPQIKRVAAVTEAARATGLVRHLVSPISTLSRGYRQRVGLAQAIVHKPDVLVLDEPTNGLDPIQIQAIRELIRNLGRTSTVILSTHILQEVEAVCDRVLVLIQGELAADAPMAELLASRTLRLVVNRDADVATGLQGLEGVLSSRILPHEPVREGFVAWGVECAPGTALVPTLLAHAATAGWTVDAIAPEQPTLEAVFKRLQLEYAQRKEAGRSA